MEQLLSDVKEARRLSEGAREAGRRRFNLTRFADEWDRLFTKVAQRGGDEAEKQLSTLEPLVVGRSHP